MTRGIRGATTCEANTSSEILEATRELLVELLAANSVATEAIGAIFFTCTPDLDAAFPAKAARDLGLVDVPLMCGVEMNVPGAPARCIRVMLLAETALDPKAVRHVYQRGAQVLRPDLVGRLPARGAGAPS